MYVCMYVLSGDVRPYQLSSAQETLDYFIQSSNSLNQSTVSWQSGKTKLNIYGLLKTQNMTNKQQSSLPKVAGGDYSFPSSHCCAKCRWRQRQKRRSCYNFKVVESQLFVLSNCRQ